MNPKAAKAFLYSVPIGTLGGLIGLGGAEFRLPVLIGPLGHAPRKAVPFNLAASLITVVCAIAIRFRTVKEHPSRELLPGLIALTVAAVIAAIVGTAIVGKLSNAQLGRVLAIILSIIGVALFVEGFLPESRSALLPESRAWHVGAGVVFGTAIGLTSSVLGVAGGELIIPTLVFAYGIGIKAAGTTSLLISLPTVAVGIMRYAAKGAYKDRQALADTVFPMGIGSVIGAVIGGLLVGFVTPSVLKIILGVILLVSAVRLYFHRHAD
jgi:uncharacterized membrane protein YfcA